MGFEQTVKNFQDNKISVLNKPVEPDASLLQQRLKSIIDKIIATPDGENLVSFLLEHNIPVAFSKATQYAAHRTNLALKEGKLMPVPGTQFILINPDQDDALLISAFLHEARHAQQCLSGMAMPDKRVSPQHLAVFTRMLEADAQATAVLKAFKMKLDGDDSLFAAGKTIGYQEMYRVAEEQYLKDPTSLDNGRLKRMIFDAWFSEADGTKHGYDGLVIGTVWPFYNGLLDCYPDNSFSKSPLTVKDLEKLGTVGGESMNYLTLPGFRSLGDPYYIEGFSPLHHLQLLTLTEAWQKTPLPTQDNLSKKAPAGGPGL
ncbi:MAG: hypothetical protein K8R48_05270 [Alphaproteobacteria bacterium]|nr:hypothetical protein [Alphaproteobacteria bacterium]